MLIEQQDSLYKTLQGLTAPGDDPADLSAGAGPLYPAVVSFGTSKGQHEKQIVYRLDGILPDEQVGQGNYGTIWTVAFTSTDEENWLEDLEALLLGVPAFTDVVLSEFEDSNTTVYRAEVRLVSEGF